MALEDTLEKLFEARATAVHGFRALVDPINEEGRSFTAEERQEFERRNAELDEFDMRIRETRKRIESDKEVDEYRQSAEAYIRPESRHQASDPLAEQEKRFLSFVRGEDPNQRSFDLDLSGLEVRKETGKRNKVVESRSTLTECVYAAGGALLPVSFRSVLYQHLVQQSAVLQTRATVLTTNSGENLIIPKTTAHPGNGTIVSEGAASGETDPTFGAGTLSAYKYGNIVQVSTEMLTDSGVDLLGYLGVAMGRSLGIAAGGAWLRGTGSSQPTGLLVTQGTTNQIVGSTGVAGVPTYAQLVKLYDGIIAPYQPQAEFVATQKTISALRQITDSYGRPLWVPSLTGDMPDTLFGHPFYIDSTIGMYDVAVNATAIAWGDWSAFFVRMVNGIRFERSNDYAFNTDMVTFRAYLRTDSILADKNAMSTYVGGTA